MVAKLTIIFFIILSLLAGFVLVIFPWYSLGKVGDWGDNYFLILVSNFLHQPVLQSAIASGWVRGAVTGLGVLNLFLAFWEIANFKQSVEMLEASGKKTVK